VRLRMPFRFGVVTLTEAPQAFVRARIRLEDGREAAGAAAELLAPKWFDKDPALSNEDNFEQLRRSLAAARDTYLAHEPRTAWAHAAPGRGLVQNYGPALVDRALLDALCRALGVSLYRAVQKNHIGAGEVEGMHLGAVFGALRPRAAVAARHTVGLVDPITAADQARRVNDDVVERFEHVFEVAPEKMTDHVQQQDIPAWDTHRIVGSRWDHLDWMHDHWADAVLSAEDLAEH